MTLFLCNQGEYFLGYNSKFSFPISTFLRHIFEFHFQFLKSWILWWHVQAYHFRALHFLVLKSFPFAINEDIIIPILTSILLDPYVNTWNLISTILRSVQNLFKIVYLKFTLFGSLYSLYVIYPNYLFIVCLKYVKQACEPINFI